MNYTYPQVLTLKNKALVTIYVDNPSSENPHP
jgi:hypothetical protein